MHPELSQWLIGMRRLLPEARLRMVTNGLLLHRNWWLVDTLEDLGNSTLKITKHLDHAQLDENIKTVMHLRKWEPVYEYGIHRWKSPRGLRLQITQPTHFLKTFRNDYHDMMPHNNDPSLAFESCVQKKCPMLWQGRLYKCGTLALTPDLLEKFQWPNRNHWLPFIHHGLAPTASDSDIAEFVANFGEPHAMCRQCPSSQDRESWFDHKHTVTLKRNIKHLDSIQS